MEDVYESLEGFAGLDGLPNINEQSSTFAFFVKKENWKVFKNKKIMNKEELKKIETSMTREQIIDRAKTLRPVADFQELGGMRYWLDGNKIHSTSYNWNKKRLKPTGYLRELGRVKTYHTGTRFFFKPSVEEMVVQCPYPEATAFMYAKGTCDYDDEQDIWTAETIYYTGDIPEEIRNREIEW